MLVSYFAISTQLTNIRVSLVTAIPVVFAFYIFFGLPKDHVFSGYRSRKNRVSFFYYVPNDRWYRLADIARFRLLPHADTELR